MPRKKISDTVKNNILVKSRRRCALCYGLDNDTNVKDGQIAHIDRNNENNTEENLAYLCLNHHNLYDSTFKQTVNFTPVELKFYKKKLEEDILTNSFSLEKIVINSNNEFYNSHDHELFLKIKDVCLENNNLNKILNFNLGTSYNCDYFCIDEDNSICLTDYFYILGMDIDNYFRDEALEHNFEWFCFYLKNAMDIISNNYFSESNTNFMIIKKYYNEFERGKVAQQFDEQISYLKNSYIAFYKRAVSLGYAN
jgi:hypothetical protein